MKMAFPRSTAVISVCSQADLRLAAFPAGGAGREGKAEGKIKETGTVGRRFQGMPLSAHCFGAVLPAPCLWTPRAAYRRKALVLLGFDRHHIPKSRGFLRFGPEAHP